ncbi:MAG: ATP-binding cassette domain-containing protein [Betaproteobacteria bacterium]|nr:ATP-binding cassette domain-containing protein [Betaproteobacteria bacterium]
MDEAALVDLPSQAPVVRVRGFAKRYGKRVAVDGVNFDIRTGEIHGLIGPDGAGKSSLMKAIAGVLAFDAGSVEVFGVTLDSEAACERIKDRIGLMPQGLGLNLYPELSVEENIDFFARLRLVAEKDLAERKGKLLAMTRLERFRDRPMKQLSGGMKQKLGLVCTLVHEPGLLILDEPTTGVDPVSRRDFWAILSELVAERGITALVSTAYMDEASRFHRLVLMYGGRFLAKGTPAEIQALAAGSTVLVNATPQEEAFVKLRELFPQVETLGPRLCVFADGLLPDDAARKVGQALEGFDVSEIQAAEPDPEDAFIAILRQRGLFHDEHRAESAATPAAISSRGGDAVEASGLTRDFGAFRAVDAVSFRVAEGAVFGLLGANGAGKTTVIKMLTGLLRPSGGVARVAGVDMRAAGQAFKERIGYMSQAFSLYTDLTVTENIDLYAGIYGLCREEAGRRRRWVIATAGLEGHEADRAASLPMGLRQRLALGCALVHRPRVLFLDEPTSGVDPVGRRQFWDILFRLSREEGVAVLVTTHYMSEVEHCDRLALMYAGRIVADATPAQMKRELEAEAGSLLELEVSDPGRAAARLRVLGFKDAALFGRRVHLLSRVPEQDMVYLRKMLGESGIDVARIAPCPVSMEDVFVYRVSALEAGERKASG